MTEPDLFSTPAAKARDDALERVQHGAEDWIGLWAATITGAAHRLQEFTTDDLWAVVPKPREPRAMGAVLNQMRKAGLIEPTGSYRRSREVSCHARPKAVWRWAG